MAKSYLSINSKVSQVVGGFNSLTDKVGDLAQLNTLEDSSLVGAINSLLSQGSVDSAAIVGILDSGQYIAISDLLTGTSGLDVVVRGGSQTITGQKTFSAEPIFQSNARVKKTSDARIRLQSTDRRDSSEVLTLTHSSTGSVLGWSDSTGVISLNVIVVPNRSATSPQPGKVQFYAGNNTLIGTLDSAAAANIATTILTKTKADALYIEDAANSVITTNLTNLSVTTAKLADSSITEPKMANASVGTAQLAASAVTTVKILDDAVTRAKLASEVQLIIYDSAGNAIKTLYGAGA